LPDIKKTAALTGHTGSVYTLCHHPSAPDTFYSGSGDGMAIRWDIKELSSGIVTAKVQGNIFSLCIIPANTLLIGQMLGGIHAISLTEKKELRNLVYQQGAIYDVLYDNAQNHILSGAGNGSLAVIDSNTLDLVKTIALSQKSIRSLALHPRQPLLATGCSDNTAYILDSETLTVVHTLAEHESTVFSVCFSPDGKYLLTGSRDARLRVWDVQNNFHLLHTIAAHMFTINCIAYSPDGKCFATASRDKTIKLWDAQTLDLLKVIDKEKHNGHVNSVNKLLWLENNTLISCSDDRSVMVWEVDSVIR
jgi:WD40 repeat protein